MMSIDSLSRAIFNISFLLMTVAMLVGFNHSNSLKPSVALAANYYYTANDSEIRAIVNYDPSGYGNWPEQLSFWCGVANIQTINAYAYWKSGASNNPYPTQDSIGLGSNALLNLSSAVSPWGLPSAPKFKANISNDGGTDPRSIAWGLYTATPYGYYYHNYVYPIANGIYKDTQNFASDYGSAGLNNPISVTINGGAHSVVVSGVQADRDPSTNASSVNINYIDVWDPWYGNLTFGSPTFYNSTGVQQWQSYTDWSTQSKWWGQSYNTLNGYDPDPSTSPGN